MSLSELASHCETYFCQQCLVWFWFGNRASKDAAARAEWTRESGVCERKVCGRLRRVSTESRPASLHVEHAAISTALGYEDSRQCSNLRQPFLPRTFFVGILLCGPIFTRDTDSGG